MVNDPHTISNFCVAILRQAVQDWEILCKDVRQGTPKRREYTFDSIEYFLKTRGPYLASWADLDIRHIINRCERMKTHSEYCAKRRKNH